MTNTNVSYPIEIKRLPSGQYEASMPDLPGYLGHGVTESKAGLDLTRHVMPVLRTLYLQNALPAASPLEKRQSITFTPPV